MTVEKNGQLAWTFEDLDLEGAYSQLMDEYSENHNRFNTINDLYWEAKRGNYDITFLDKKFEEVSSNSYKLWTILLYIANLIDGKKFNEKRDSL